MPDTFLTTADDVLAGIDLTARQIVVTGATAGLGLSAATAFARAGADVLLVGRNAARLEAEHQAVAASGSGTVSVEQADLADLNAVDELGKRLAGNLSRLDVLVLNSGVMAAPLERSPQGHEMQLAVSHLGHHLLTTALLDLLRASTGRVIALTSSGHWLSGITTVAVHPGVIKTELQRHLSTEEEAHVLAMSAERGEVRSIEAGAASIVWAATAPEITEHNGSYIANCAIADQLRAPHASDPADAARL